MESPSPSPASSAAEKSSSASTLELVFKMNGQLQDELISKDKLDAEAASTKAAVVKECFETLVAINNNDAMTARILETTLIWKTVRHWKNHPDDRLRAMARKLLQQWKQVFQRAREARAPTRKLEEKPVGANKRKKKPLSVIVSASVPSKATKKIKPASTKKTNLTTNPFHHSTSTGDNSTTKTRVVNVKVAYIRPQYNNLQEWVNDTTRNVYIGRRGIVFVNGQRFPTRDSRWCNPFKIAKSTSTRENVIQQYETHLRALLKNDPSLKDTLVEDLDGKCLGCWCHPEACHGDVLVRAIAEIKTGTGDW